MFGNLHAALSLACHIGTLSIPSVKKKILLHLAAHGVSLLCNFSFLAFSCSTEVQYFCFNNTGSLSCYKYSIRCLHAVY